MTAISVILTEFSESTDPDPDLVQFLKRLIDNRAVLSATQSRNPPHMLSANSDSEAFSEVLI